MEKVKLSSLEKEGYKGIDVSLENSLGDYQMAWKQDNDNIIFCHKTSHGQGFTYTSFNKNTDIYNEFSFIDWDEFHEFNGLDKIVYDGYDLGIKIFDLVAFYGIENIMGSDYYEGFEIDFEN